MKRLKPLIRWMGGKSQLINDLFNHLPYSRFNRYYEPFVGGGALLLFKLLPKRAIINDINYELMNLYNVIKEHPKELIKHYNTTHINDKKYYSEIRKIDKTSLSDIERASTFLFIKKCCFNGVERYNSKGEFNVPFSNPPSIELNIQLIKDMHLYFRNNDVKILNADYLDVIKDCKEGDFVYFDPPYDDTDKYIVKHYFGTSWSRQNQEILFNEFVRLSNIGVKLMLSNSNSDFIRELYKDFKINEVTVSRSITRNAEDRKIKVCELIITNY